MCSFQVFWCIFLLSLCVVTSWSGWSSKTTAGGDGSSFWSSSGHKHSHWLSNLHFCYQVTFMREQKKKPRSSA